MVQRMDLQCPHCTKFINVEMCRLYLAEESGREYSMEEVDAEIGMPHMTRAKDGTWTFGFTICLACNGPIVRRIRDRTIAVIAYPRSSSRPPLSAHVPSAYREDYEEAALILTDSPKASAALSRRCLQAVLRDSAGVGPSDLYSEIEDAIPTGGMASHIVESLHTLWRFGNVAAHPTKSTNTGEIVPVGLGEAEWCLNVLDFLFDFYFVGPAEAEARRQEFEKKLNG